MLTTIGRRIRDRRLELGLSVDELALKLGKNRATVYRYEGDEIENLPISIIAPLAEALDVSPGYLMGWEKEKTPPDTYSQIFKSNLSDALEVLDTSAFSGVGEAEADYAFLERLTESPDPLSLEDACKAADLLGESLDSMVGIDTSATRTDDGRTGQADNEIISLLSHLSPEKTKEALNYLRYLVERGE